MANGAFSTKLPCHYTETPFLDHLNQLCLLDKTEKSRLHCATNSKDLIINCFTWVVRAIAFYTYLV